MRPASRRPPLTATRMQAIAITQPGPADVLRPVTRPDPTAGEGEVVIRVQASGVNRPDVMQRLGFYPPPPGASDLPGLEVAGVIESGDEAALRAAGLAVGDAVCALLAGGGYAERAVAPVAQCLPVPRGWSAVEAAGLPETFFTVWSNVFMRAGLAAGETLLVQGGSSGIGVTAIQLARALDARVIVTAGSAEKCQACLALGAHHAIDYKRQDFAAEVMRLTDQRGADVILDMVAGDYIAREIDCLAEDGRLLVIALQGGVQAGFNAARLLMKRLSIIGSTLRARPPAYKAAVARELREKVWPLLEQGRVRPVIDRVFAATDAAAAHAWMESGRHVGKIILEWK